MSDPIDEFLEQAGIERDETAPGDVDRFGPRAAWGPTSKEVVERMAANGLVDPELVEQSGEVERQATE